MYNKIKTLLVCTIALSFNAQAELYYEIALESGGDTIATTTRNNDLNTGGGVKFAIGYESSPNDEHSFRASIGRMRDSIDAIHGSAELTTTVIDLVSFFNTDIYHFGAGVTGHLSPSYEVEVYGFFYNSLVTVDFDTAIGFLAVYEVDVSENTRIGARYSVLEYKLNNTTFDAGSFGLYLAGHF